MPALPEQIEQQIAEIIQGHELVLLEILKRGQTNSTVLEVIVDSEQGADLERIARITRQISTLLDEHENTIPGRYRLEVSTPGLDRPIDQDWQYRKNIGRLVKISYQDEEGNIQTQFFRLLGISDKELNLETVAKSKGKSKSSKKGEPVVIDRERVKKVVVEPEI